jgi:hypothetical protein
MLKNVGTVRLIDKSLTASSALSHCRPLEREVTWNQEGLAGTDGKDGKDGLNGTNGTDGQDGVSVTTAPEPAGRAAPTAASKLTSTSSAAYVCNGEDGSDGKDVSNGAPWDIVQHSFPALVPGVSAGALAETPARRRVQHSWAPAAMTRSLSRGTIGGSRHAVAFRAPTVARRL